jgi:hypothetical protein
LLSFFNTSILLGFVYIILRIKIHGKIMNLRNESEIVLALDMTKRYSQKNKQNA